jgi:hypothetical protein
MLPIVVVPPEFHARVGTWRVFTDGATFTGGGDWNPVNGLMTFPGGSSPGATIAGTMTLEFPGDPYLLLDGAGLGGETAVLDLPHGFEPDPDYSVEIAVRSTDDPGDVDLCEVEFFHFGDTVTVRNNPTPGSGGDPVFALTDMDFAKLETLGHTSVIATASATKRLLEIAQSLFANWHQAYGTYVAFAWWWRVQGVDACGNRFTGPFFQDGVDPGPPWVRFDPDDEAAHPTPVVVNVSPNHGLLAGGTPFEIFGSGFGVGCTVTFDGVPATDVVAVTETRIIGVAPAHAAGLVDVVVTNTDGVSS